MFKFKISLLAILFLGLFGHAQSALAANHYIRAGATGANNGTGWNDAWTSFGAISTANWLRGDVYYVAGGTYTENVTIPSKTGTSWITIKKANVVDNSGDPGWNASYATGQAVIVGKFTSLAGYVEIDGVTGSGTSGHGIKIYSPTSPTGISAVVVFTSSGNPYHMHHVEVQGPGYDYGSVASDGIYFNSTSTNTRGLHFSYCYIHELPRNGITLGSVNGVSYSESPVEYGLLFENNVLERASGVSMRYPNIHGQGIQFYYYPLTYSIFRNNIFRNNFGQAHISLLGGVSTDHIRIYNNVFYNNNGDCTVYGRADSGSNTTITQLYRQLSNYEALTGRALTNITKGATGLITSVTSGVGSPVNIGGGMSGGIVNEAGDIFSFPTTCRSAYFLATTIYSSAGNRITYAEIYNNTFYNQRNAQINFVTPSDETGSVAKNNLWVNSWFTSLEYTPPLSNTGYYNCTDGTYDPVNTESSDPFINSAGYNFKLKSTANAVNAGADLSSVFTTDIDNLSRPQGPAWDIGAYEYESGYVPPPPDTIPPLMPSGLSVK